MIVARKHACVLRRRKSVSVRKHTPENTCNVILTMIVWGSTMTHIQDERSGEDDSLKAPDRTDVGTRSVAQRIVNADGGFLHTLMERGGLTRDQAIRAMRTLLHVRAAKLDPVLGVITVQHGAFYEGLPVGLQREWLTGWRKG